MLLEGHMEEANLLAGTLSCASEQTPVKSTILGTEMLIQKLKKMHRMGGSKMMT
jgi:hypothetical protein